MKTTVVIMASILLALIGGLLIFVETHSEQYPPALKVSSHKESGIKYKVVTIEGRQFVATQSAYGYWNLAGPIDR